MCGIIGYTGTRPAQPLLLEGLHRLEYRGYDSSGMATLAGSSMHLRKTRRPHSGSGPLPARPSRPRRAPASATPAGPRTGRPTIATPIRTAAAINASPSSITASSKTTPRSKDNSQADGVVFHSDTDTEVIAQLIARQLDADARRSATSSRPSAGRCPCSRAPTVWPFSAAVDPGLVVGARLGSPLVLGIGDGEHFLASDPGALVGRTPSASSTCRTINSAC